MNFQNSYDAGSTAEPQSLAKCKTIETCILALLAISCRPVADPQPKTRYSERPGEHLPILRPKLLWSYRERAQASLTNSLRPLSSMESRFPRKCAICTPAYSDPSRQWGNGIFLCRCAGTGLSSPSRFQFQVNDRTPVIRFRYILKADQPKALNATPARTTSPICKRHSNNYRRRRKLRSQTLPN